MGRGAGRENVFGGCFHSANESQVRLHVTPVPAATFNPSQSGHRDMPNTQKPGKPQRNEEQVNRQERVEDKEMLASEWSELILYQVLEGPPSCSTSQH